MKYDNIRAFEKHLEGAKPLHFSRHYLIMGKEEFECKEASELLIQFLLPSENRDLTLHTIDGDGVELDQLMADLNSQSMFAPLRVIHIRHAEKLKKAILDELEKYVTRIPKTQYLVMSSSGIAKNTRFYKASEKEGIVLELPEIKPWEKEKRLSDWVNKKVTEARKLMPYQVCQAFVKHVGSDAQTLLQELEKLFCYCGERQEIHLQDVNKICTNLHMDTVWQLGESIFRRDASTALKITRSLLVDGQSLLPMLRQIRSQFQTEFHICTLLQNGKHPHDIQQEYPYMKGQILDRHIQSATHYGFEAFRRGILLIDATEMKVKNSQIEEQLLADLLMIQLTKK